MYYFANNIQYLKIEYLNYERTTIRAFDKRSQNGEKIQLIVNSGQMPFILFALFFERTVMKFTVRLRLKSHLFINFFTLVSLLILFSAQKGREIREKNQ